mmetsp:Transcript_126904/g.355398  ORF Transcript_126904/g.355398 Transcript_126904/m.355398 type:complete len:266 (-) Transcript_126904:694-1491(-)
MPSRRSGEKASRRAAGVCLVAALAVFLLVAFGGGLLDGKAPVARLVGLEGGPGAGRLQVEGLPRLAGVRPQLLGDERRALELRGDEGREGLHDLDVLVVELPDGAVELRLVDHLNHGHGLRAPTRQSSEHRDGEDAVGAVPGPPVDLLVETRVLVGVRDRDQLPVGRAFPGDAGGLRDADLLARVRGDGPELLFLLIDEEHSAPIGLHQLVRMHGYRQYHRLHPQVLRQCLDHLKQRPCTLAGHDGGPINLRIAQGDADMLCQIL